MEKSEMFLKILSFALLLSGCVSESRYEYETVNGNDLAFPLEIDLMREDGVDPAPRQRRSLTSTEPSFAFEGPDSNHPPPHILAAAGPTGSLLAGLSSSPTLADKVKPPAVTFPAGTQGAAAGKSKGPKKVPSALGADEKSKVYAGAAAAAAGVSGSINTPVTNGHGTGGGSTSPPPITPSSSPSSAPSSTPLTVITDAIYNSPVVASKNNTAYVTHSQAAAAGQPPASSVAAPTSASTSSSESEDFGDFPSPEEEISNRTLAMHHILSSVNDTHEYYNSSLSRDEGRARQLWVELTESNSKRQDILSNAHRRAVTQKLSFDFPFYGHLIHNVTITTGGFLYTGEQTHPWLAATQFIAPLMANFDTSLTQDSVIRYLDNETQFTVTWENVRLQDKPGAGVFTFQVSLYQSGDITFVYKTIPVVAIDDDHHPVKVGLSDSYLMDNTIFFYRRTAIYEYHRVAFNHTDISNWTSIHLTALPTCLDHTDCESCLLDMMTSFTCSWCPTANRCSTGLDRKRQDWVHKGCDKNTITNAHQCASTNYAPHVGADAKAPFELKPEEVREMSVSSLLFGFISVACVVGVAVWGTYAYTNPMTSSGQILIRYRPSRWTMKRGEARYTAATIHM